jgi:hypothetical protein
MLDALKYVDFLQKKTPKAIAQKENGYPKHPERASFDTTNWKLVILIVLIPEKVNPRKISFIIKFVQILEK